MLHKQLTQQRFLHDHSLFLSLFLLLFFVATFSAWKWRRWSILCLYTQAERHHKFIANLSISWQSNLPFGDSLNSECTLCHTLNLGALYHPGTCFGLERSYKLYNIHDPSFTMCTIQYTLYKSLVQSKQLYAYFFLFSTK